MNTLVVSDEMLISNYINGDHSALDVLINRHSKKVYAYILMLVRDKTEADDIFQDAFVKVINTIRGGSYNEEGKFVQWVMRIAHNLVIDYFRNNKKMPQADGGEDYDIFDTIGMIDSNVEQRMINEQIEADVKMLVDLLPMDQKEVLKMRIYDDMSFKEIADATNVSINTALGRMRYALINLRKIAKEKDIILTA